MSCRPLSVLTTFFLILLCCSVLAQDAHVHMQHTQQQQQQQVHQQMDELVDSVKHAVHEADAASHDKTQVVDVGQSLTLLETKFSNLRSALAAELGVSKEKMGGSAAISKELMDKSTDLVRSVVSQRDEITKLTTDMNDLDNTIKLLRDGLLTFENDIRHLNSIVQQVHRSNNELVYHNDALNDKVERVVKDGHSAFSNRNNHGFKYKLMVFFIILELFIFASYVYFTKIAKSPYFQFGSKSSRSSSYSSKAYGKFG